MLSPCAIPCLLILWFHYSNNRDERQSGIAGARMGGRYSTRGYNDCMQPFEIEQALAQAAAKLELMQVYL
jgi:hypothetical protein